MNELIEVKNENGRQLVSAKDLYLGLGLDKSNWSRWYKTNIINNEFFSDGNDFIGVRRNDEGNETQDFIITIEFAKHIAMMAKTKKSHQYRNYFIECEKRLKKVLPTTYKEALLALVAAEEEKERLQAEKEHKQEVIEGLTNNVSVTTKKDIINRVVRWKKANYRERYNQMYQSFKEIYHIDLKARCEGYNLKQAKLKDKLSVIKYADKMGYINDLYDIACKLYESDVNEIKDFLGIIY